MKRKLERLTSPGGLRRQDETAVWDSKRTTARGSGSNGEWRRQDGAREEEQQAYDNKGNGRGLTVGEKSYQQSPSRKSKKAGMKREGSPYNPYKRKARGKENNPGANSTGLFACERPRGREGIRKRLIEAAVEDALKAFCGTRGKPGETCDQNLWAKFAWRFGWGLLRELTLQGVSEMREHRRPVRDRDKPKILQRLISAFWRNNKRTTTRETMRGAGEDNKRTTTRETMRDAERNNKRTTTSWETARGAGEDNRRTTTSWETAGKEAT